jgi:selenide,water dikinase
MDLAVLRQIIEGGADKLTEAGVVLMGGHSIEDKELKYGLSVTGFVHPSRVLIKQNLQPGDRLVLTKPIGTGIVNTAIKAGMASEELTDKATRLMAFLNRDAASIMCRFDIHGCTDVTGFGLLGHLAEMVCGSGRSVRVLSDCVPIISEALEFAAMGLIPAGAYRNREFRKSMISFEETVELSRQDAMFDPQTSGGLLISVKGRHADELVAALKEGGILDAAQIGEIVDHPEERIWVE